ncbi:hypothetical protein F11_16985 [Rhodospirillum rubrum F11]|nr:hypothetical protein F11_16985 [Rhodospirillum rubrum F11]MBK5955821.1 hypothetical protein [Rhodospirillum rubrum]
MTRDGFTLLVGPMVMGFTGQRGINGVCFAVKRTLMPWEFAPRWGKIRKTETRSMVERVIHGNFLHGEEKS